MDQLDNQLDGQMTISDLFKPPERLFAVSRIFARARKSMSLAEQKTFVYALSRLKFTETSDSECVYLDKQTLAQIVGVSGDPDHLSVNLKRYIKDLPRHSFIEIDSEDLDLYESGMFITRLTMLKNRIRIKFEKDYLSLFTGLSTNYITMWSADIFQMESKRSVQFYEFLRSVTDTRKDINSVALGVKALKEMFDIPMDGKGSYMREKGGFNRPVFEQRVIDPLCEDLQKSRMITLVTQPDGKAYEKVKRGKRVDGYRFYWTFTDRPAVASADEVHEIQNRVDKDPRILKVAKDLLTGNRKPKKDAFHAMEQSGDDKDELFRIIQEKQEQERQDEQIPGQTSIFDYLNKK